MFTSIRGDYFDRTVFATFFGLSGLIINIGTVSSPVLTGYLFDTKGDYSIAFFYFRNYGFNRCSIMFFSS
ncbi:MAG: hypothetical protein CM1200mP33_2340 [Chloroflexota bacterium]|nr:MAG: hypothetical protein CM1200mP33_2340 [Chloroflexota bacterium]